MNNDSEAVGRARRADAEDDLLFPADGNFSRVVPLSSEAGDEAVAVSEAGDEAAPPVAVAPDEQSEPEDELVTLVPARALPAASPVLPSRTKKGVEQSWGLTAAVLAVSILAGVAVGAYIIRSQNAAETYGPAASNVEAAAAPGDEAAANRAAEKVIATEPAEQPVPQAPAPQAGHDGLAAETAPTPKALPRVADITAARRGVEPEPRAERPARAVSEARVASAPRLTPGDAAPRRVERPAPAGAPERSLPISSPPPSSRPKKVIQWP